MVGILQLALEKIAGLGNWFFYGAVIASPGIYLVTDGVLRVQGYQKREFGPKRMAIKKKWDLRWTILYVLAGLAAPYALLNIGIPPSEPLKYGVIICIGLYFFLNGIVKWHQYRMPIELTPEACHRETCHQRLLGLKYITMGILIPAILVALNYEKRVLLLGLSLFFVFSHLILARLYIKLFCK